MTLIVFLLFLQLELQFRFCGGGGELVTGGGLSGRTRHASSSPNGVTTVLGGRAIRFIVKLVLIVFSICLLLTFSSFFFAKTTSRDVVSDKGPTSLSTIGGRIGGCTNSHKTRLTRCLVGSYFNISSFFVLIFLTITKLGLVHIHIIHL